LGRGKIQIWGQLPQTPCACDVADETEAQQLMKMKEKTTQSEAPEKCNAMIKIV